MEELAPITVRRVQIKTALGDVERNNVQYYNVIVRNCPPYVPNPAVKHGFIRATPITRMKKVTNLHGTGLDWPDHPKDTFGDHLGAIVILQTLDNQILILRNDVLWGLPKGVRNYSEFHRIKTEFTESGEILKFDENYKFEQVESESDNICRETLEETGIVLDPEKLIRWAGEDDPSAYTKFFYQLNFAAADYHEILLKNGTDHENDEMKWIDREELSTLLQLHRSSRHSKIFNHVTFMFLSQWAKTYASQKI